MGKTTRKITGLRLRGEVYYADTRANGVRISQRIGKVSETTAKAILSKLISDAFKNEYFPKNESTDILLRLLLKEYVEKKLNFVKSSSTRIHLFKPIDRLLGFKTASELRISDSAINATYNVINVINVTYNRGQQQGPDSQM